MLLAGENKLLSAVLHALALYCLPDNVHACLWSGMEWDVCRIA